MARGGDFSRAAATYKLILKEEPDNPLALTLLSSLYHNQGLAAEIGRLQAGAPEQDPSLKSGAAPDSATGLSGQRGH